MSPEGPRGWVRSELAESTLLRLQRGGALAPDVLLVELPQGRAVVKDFAPRPRWIRETWGRWQTRREARALAALAGHPAVPRLLGRLDAWALALEHRPGRRLSSHRPWTFGPAFHRALEEAVRDLHRRGVVHLDLGHRGNVRADLHGRPVLIDFGAALCFRPGGAGARWLLPLLARLDLRALAKWRRRLLR